jgi:hypothetical protein
MGGLTDRRTDNVFKQLDDVVICLTTMTMKVAAVCFVIPFRLVDIY